MLLIIATTLGIKNCQLHLHLNCEFSNSSQIQSHVNHLHAKMVENAAQKKENGNVIAYQNSLVQRVRMKEIHVRKFHIIHV